MLAGLVTGILPMLLYNVRGSQNGNTLDTIIGLINGGSSHMTHTFTTLVQELQGTIGISIPMMTGEPFCPVSEVSLLGMNSPKSPTCTLLHWSWGVGYLLLLIVALIVACGAVWRMLKAYRQRQDKSLLVHQYQGLVRTTGRLTLLVSGLLSLLIYTYSNAPIGWPGIHGHYIIGLLIITPTLIAPLWHVLVRYLGEKQRPAAMRGTTSPAASGLVLALIGILLVVGVFNAFKEVPFTTQDYQTDMHLI